MPKNVKASKVSNETFMPLKYSLRTLIRYGIQIMPRINDKL